MAINFDSAFGIHEHSLKLRTTRAEVLARNLANADTPNFKARDIDFRSILQQQYGGDMKGGTLQQTKQGHSTGLGSQFSLSGTGTSLSYRAPWQPSIDGNTVETEQELARFAKNSSDYQASLTFLNGRIRGLLSAIKGE